MGSCYRFVSLGRQLAERGIACLTFDFRGCGESAGRFIDVTCNRLKCDLLGVIEWLADREDADASRIGLCGSSFGAFTAACVAQRIPGLRALVFWAGVASPGRLFDRAMTADAWRLLDAQGWLDHRGSPLGKPFFSLDADDGPAALATAAKPLLMFHARGDTEVPIDQSEAYLDALQKAGVEVRLERLDLNDHGMRNVKVNERIVAESASWFESALMA
ncbi:MAG: alpha/beta fold hydrolase [Phycisphaerales bacterium]|nr:alpha/beta fold hydrolase [Phycisphaerales bacterium]MCB9857206.1 alpha/beta fold hydrolase [Phycisphaerales bacterium]MCB9863081.1 alpha/beta fold hydrolase [Phycisphaerales bacterium]